MSILDYSYSLLTKLKNEEVTFSHLVNKEIGPEVVDSNEIIPLKDCLKAVVNRYYFLSWEIKHYLKGVILEEEVLDYLILTLSFVRYSRNIDKNEIKGLLYQKLDQLNCEIDQDLINNMLYEFVDKITSLPEVFNDNFPKKISLNYSYPEWLVTMIRKHFGTRNTYKSISSSRKSVPISICANELSVNEIDNPSFIKSETTSHSYFFVGKNKLFEEELFLKRKIFVLDQSEQKVLEDLKIMQGEKVLIIGKVEPTFVANTCIKICDLGKVRVASPTFKDDFELKKVVQKFKFNTFEGFESPINLVCTHSSYDNDRVIVWPKSSEFGLIRKKPEILLSFKKEKFDVLLQEQYEHLKEASNFVKKDGELDYIVYTLNKKESFMMVRRFLNDHPKFGLIEEKLIFPFEYKGEGVYFARIRKIGN